MVARRNLATRKRTLEYGWLLVTVIFVGLVLLRRFLASMKGEAMRASGSMTGHVPPGCVEDIVRGSSARSKVIQITSFPGSWAKSKFRGVLSRTNQYPLVVYRDDVEKVSSLRYRRAVSCEIQLFRVFPWLTFETHAWNSSLNRFIRFAGAYEPFSRPMRSKVNHLLFRKMLAVWHMLGMVADGTLLIWLDSDVTIENKLSEEVVAWLKKRDITYIPTYHAHKQSQQRMTADWYSKLRSDWFVETGIFSVTKSAKSLTFFKRIVELYLGDLQQIAEMCVSDSVYDKSLKHRCKCSSPAVYTNLYMNDIFVFSLLTHASLSKNRCISKYALLEELLHGWFGTSAECSGLTKSGSFSGNIRT